MLPKINKLWLVVLLLGLIVRGLVLITILPDPLRIFYETDAEQYIALAQGMVQTGRFGFHDAGGFHYDVWRTPSYPALLAILIAISGDPRPLLLTAAVQALIGVAITFGVMVLARTVAQQMQIDAERSALIAGILYAVAPISAIMTAYAYAETIFGALLVGAALLILWATQRNQILLAGLAGLTYGAAILTRPIGLPLLPLLLLLPLVYVPGSPVRKTPRRLLYSVALLIGVLVMTLPWMYRNQVLFGRFALASVSDSNLLYYNASSLEAHLQNISIEEARDQVYDRLGQQNYAHERWPFAADGAMARQIISEHPIAFVWYNGIDALNGFRPGFSFALSLFGYSVDAADSSRIFTQGPMLATLGAFILLHLLILSAGFLIGLACLAIRKQWMSLILFGGIPALLLYLPGYASNARFRAPVEPFMAVLAAISLQILISFSMSLLGRESGLDAGELSLNKQ